MTTERDELIWKSIEQESGTPLVDPVIGPSGVDAYRAETYQAYERFLRDRLLTLDQQRPGYWNRDYANTDFYLQSCEPMRVRLKAMLGFWTEPGERHPVSRRGEETLLQTADFIARRFRFDILPGLTSYAVELVPLLGERHPGLLIQHGYGGTPELACGLTSQANDEDFSYRSMGIRAVRRGFHVMAVHHPSGYGSRSDTEGSLPAFPSYGQQYGKNRLHRLAVMAGGTLFGMDMMGSSRGVDLLVDSPNVDANRIGMYGLSQGGQSTVYLPALDQRIRASVASAWFNSRLPKLIGGTRGLCYLDSLEEDKFFADGIRYFSDADVVSLICPRAFAVEAGLHDTAVDFELACEEFERARSHYEHLGIPQRIEFIPHRQGHVAATGHALEFLKAHLG